MSGRGGKVVLVGSATVGKSCLLVRLRDNEYNDSGGGTVGGCSAEINFALQASEPPDVVSFELWDTAGQERYRSLVPVYARDARVVLLTYDTANRESFNGLDEWFECIKLSAGRGCQYIIVGAKADLEDGRQVADADAEQLQKRIGAVAHVLVSAKDNWGIDILVKAIREAIAQADAADKPADVMTFHEPPKPKKKSRCC
jgi:small GTP-binding protein